MLRTIRHTAWIASGSMLLAGCASSREQMDVANDEVSLVSIVPTSGTVGVDPGAAVVLFFSRPMMMGMDTLVVLHEGSATGPVVPMSTKWSADRMMLICQPAVPLRGARDHTLHLVPGMMDANAHRLNWMNGPVMGGSTAGGMMGARRDRIGIHNGMTLTFTTR